jgi:hypothetical protein
VRKSKQAWEHEPKVIVSHNFALALHLLLFARGVWQKEHHTDDDETLVFILKAQQHGEPSIFSL